MQNSASQNDLNYDGQISRAGSVCQSRVTCVRVHVGVCVCGWVRERVGENVLVEQDD